MSLQIILNLITLILTKLQSLQIVTYILNRYRIGSKKLYDWFSEWDGVIRWTVHEKEYENEYYVLMFYLWGIYLGRY